MVVSNGRKVHKRETQFLVDLQLYNYKAPSFLVLDRY